MSFRINDCSGRNNDLNLKKRKGFDYPSYIIHELNYFVHCFLKLNKNCLRAIRIAVTSFCETLVCILEFNIT